MSPNLTVPTGFTNRCNNPFFLFYYFNVHILFYVFVSRSLFFTNTKQYANYHSLSSFRGAELTCEMRFFFLFSIRLRIYIFSSYADRYISYPRFLYMYSFDTPKNNTRSSCFSFSFSFFFF